MAVLYFENIAIYHVAKEAHKQQSQILCDSGQLTGNQQAEKFEFVLDQISTSNISSTQGASRLYRTRPEQYAHIKNPQTFESSNLSSCYESSSNIFYQKLRF